LGLDRRNNQDVPLRHSRFIIAKLAVWRMMYLFEKSRLKATSQENCHD